MKYLKINNLTNKFGQPDYKGLNLDLFINGSHAYKVDHTICVLATEEESIPTHVDLIELTEEEYDVEYANIREEQEQHNAQPQLQDEVDSLKTQLKATQEALDFLLMGGM